MPMLPDYTKEYVKIEPSAVKEKKSEVLLIRKEQIVWSNWAQKRG